jgi:hypothetical protein
MEPTISAVQREASVPTDAPPSAALDGLRRFTASRPAQERCELCGTALCSEHSHLLQRKSRQITCSCDACAILFCGQEGARFLRIPRRIERLNQLSIDALTWDAMLLPINLVYFVRRVDGRTEAFYPSPAGAMSSLLELPDMEVFFRNEPDITGMAAEVEALLVNRIGDATSSFIVPIDVCYRLVGTIRTSWRGLSGGHGVWKAIADFFAELDRVSTPAEASHA